MDSAVEFVDVHKEYPFYKHITAGFKSFIFHLPKNIKTFKKTRFEVLKSLSFVIKKGETFGIIGRNGSGKSTVLSLMAGVIKQDRGIVKTSGKVSSLLELGSGFHPDLSGIENIILNGILMGNTRHDMLKKVDKIVEFSELGEFIYQPLRTYSSGMHIRLGFSVAVHIDPEILLIDEALAVGDMNFQKKCMKKMIEFKESGATIIMVSHDMNSIARLCDRVMWLDNGTINAVGKPVETIERYMGSSAQETELRLAKEARASATDPEINVSASSGEQGTAPASVSWWDSPLVIELSENLITGDPGTSFYDFLKKTYGLTALEKGLSICNRLEGIEANAVLHNVCSSFDVIKKGEQIKSFITGDYRLPENQYDLVLCIDVLNRCVNPGLALKKIASSLKDRGVIIALEYVGPPNFNWSAKERDIARTLSDDMKLEGESASASQRVSLTPGNDTVVQTDSPGSYDVIPSLERYFDVVGIRYCGGPLFDLILNRLVTVIDPNDYSDLRLLKAIVSIDQFLIKEGITKSSYAMIIAKKRIK